MPKELQKNQEQDTQLRLSSRSVRNVRFAQKITGVGNTGAVVNSMIDLGATLSERFIVDRGLSTAIPMGSESSFVSLDVWLRIESGRKASEGGSVTAL